MVKGCNISNDIFESSQHPNGIFVPLNLILADEHKINSIGIMFMHKNGRPFAFEMQYNKIKITNHGLKIIFITLSSLAKFRVRIAHMGGICNQ